MKKLSTIVFLFLFISAPIFSQTFLWSQTEDTDAIQRGMFLHTDADNNVYLGAHSAGDIYLIKYNQDGIKQFSKSTTGNQLSGMAVRDDGYFSLSGYIYVNSNRDGLLQVYGSNGSSVFNQQFNSADQLDMFNDVAVDAGNNTYVTGESSDGTNYSALTIKYSPTGSPQWIQRYGDAPDLFVGMKINVNEAGEVFTSGVLYRSITQKAEVFVIHYDENGNMLHNYESPISLDPELAITFTLLDNEDNLYIGGIASTGGEVDGFILKIKDGVLIWSQIIESPDNLLNLYNGSFDQDGNIVVCGQSGDVERDAYYAKISPASAMIYEKTFAGLDAGFDGFINLFVKDAYSYFCGFSQGIGTFADYQVVVADTDGEVMWEARYNGFGNGEDAAYNIALDHDENVIVTGRAAEQAGYFCTTVKFSNPLGIYHPAPIESQSIEVFPNPAGDLLTLTCEVLSVDASYAIIGLSGMIVKTGVLTGHETTKIGLDDIPPGIYFIQITDGLKQYNAKFVKK